MVASDDFAEFLREQLEPVGRVSMRRMFGKIGLFCDGVMLGMITDNTLYFRVDDHNRELFKEAERRLEVLREMQPQVELGSGSNRAFRPISSRYSVNFILS